MFTTMTFWLWAATVPMALLYVTAGFMKAVRPIPDLANMIGWPGDVPPGLVRFVGVAELAGAFGLVLPVLTGILPWLTPLAAIGLSIIQALAIPFHARRGETAKTLPLNLVLVALSLFIVWGYRGLLGL